jgi:hypothetical protein
MPERQEAILHLQPHMIPALRKALSAAVDQVNDALVGLNRQGYLPEPWLGDESSIEVAAFYTSRAMSEPNSSYQSLVAYQAELRRVHETLRQMEDEYHRSDHDAFHQVRRRT